MNVLDCQWVANTRRNYRRATVRALMTGAFVLGFLCGGGLLLWLL